jgi:hypothetical protein
MLHAADCGWNTRTEHDLQIFLRQCRHFRQQGRSQLQVVRNPPPEPAATLREDQIDWWHGF